MKSFSFLIQIFFVTTLFMLNGCALKGSGQDAKSFLGNWEIYKLDNLHGHSSRSLKLAKESLGKKVEFGKDFVRSEEDNFVFLKGTRKNISYSMKTRVYHLVNGIMENDDYESCSLAGFDLPGAYKDKSIFLILKNELGETRFDVSKDGELVTCAEDIFVYLRKVKKSE